MWLNDDDDKNTRVHHVLYVSGLTMTMTTTTTTTTTTYVYIMSFK